MNNRFDWNRFGKVLKKDFHSLWPTFGITMIILAALPFTIWLLALVIDHTFTIGPDWRVIMIMMVSGLAALMLPSRLYRTMNLRNEGIYYAMLPASKLEKYISMLIFTFIVAPVAVYLGSMLIDIILTLLPAGPYREWLWQGVMGFPIINVANVNDGTMTLTPGYHNGWVVATMWTGFLSTPAIFLYAATLFRKHKVLFTFLVLYLIEFVGSIILIPILVALSQTPDFMEWLYDTFHLWTPERIISWLCGITTVFNSIIAILFCWMTWRRLKKMAY